MALKHSTIGQCVVVMILIVLKKYTVISQKISYETLLIEVHHRHVLRRGWVLRDRSAYTVSVLGRFSHYMVLLLLIEVEGSFI
jgi:hypothetical protein